MEERDFHGASDGMRKCPVSCWDGQDTRNIGGSCEE